MRNAAGQRESVPRRTDRARRGDLAISRLWISAGTVSTDGSTTITHFYLIDARARHQTGISCRCRCTTRSGPARCPDAVLREPDLVPDEINRLFPWRIRRDSYFTINYGIYQASTRRCVCSSAGHPPALVLLRDGAGVTVSGLSTPASPIGMFADTVYTSDSCRCRTVRNSCCTATGVRTAGPKADGKSWYRDDFVSLCMALTADRTGRSTISETAAVTHPGWGLRRRLCPGAGDLPVRSGTPTGLLVRVHLTTVAQAVAMFVATNIDDLVVLMVFFGGLQGATRRPSRASWRASIWVSSRFSWCRCWARSGRDCCPTPPSYPGVVPCCSASGPPGWPGDTATTTMTTGRWWPPRVGTATVAAVTANGATTSASTCPSSPSPASGIPAYLIVIGVGLWCLLSQRIAAHPAVAAASSAGEHIVLPVVLIGIGVAVLVEGGAFDLWDTTVSAVRVEPSGQQQGVLAPTVRNDFHGRLNCPGQERRSPMQQPLILVPLTALAAMTVGLAVAPSAFADCNSTGSEHPVRGERLKDHPVRRRISPPMTRTPAPTTTAACSTTPTTPAMSWTRPIPALAGWALSTGYGVGRPGIGGGGGNRWRWRETVVAVKRWRWRPR